MEYNKTKRGLEKAAAIVGIVFSILDIIGLIIVMIVGCVYMSGYFDSYYGIDGVLVLGVSYKSTGRAMFFLGLILFIVSILWLVYSIKLVKSPFNANGELKQRKATRIWFLVLSILSGNIIALGLMIAVLCLKDYKQPKQAQTNVSNPNATSVNQPTAGQEYLEFYNKIQEVKRLKSLEIIDNEAYKKALVKIVQEIAKK